MILLALTLAAAPQVPQTTKDGGPNRQVCKTKPATGTRFPTKTCRTAAQWEAMAEQSTRMTKELVDRPFLADCRVDRTGC